MEAHHPAASLAAMSRDTINLFVALDAIRYQVVAQNADRIDQMLERFQRTLNRNESYPDAAFSERVIRPLMTWLKALTYLPDEGEFAKIAQCAEAMLEHIPAPESEVRRPLRELGSTERLDAREDPIEVTRGLVNWTIPLLHRFVVMLKCLATGERSPDTPETLLEVIRRHEHLPAGYSDGAHGTHGELESGVEYRHPFEAGVRVSADNPASKRIKRHGIIEAAAAADFEPAIEPNVGKGMSTRDEAPSFKTPAGHEPLYASIQPRDASARKRHRSEPGELAQGRSSVPDADHGEPLDLVVGPRQAPSGWVQKGRSMPRSSGPECREVGTQTEAPSWIADMKRDPAWRTNPIWWESFEARHQTVRIEPARAVEDQREEALVDAGPLRRYASVVDVRAAQAVVNRNGNGTSNGTSDGRGRRPRIDKVPPADEKTRKTVNRNGHANGHIDGRRVRFEKTPPADEGVREMLI
ncbi:hypothetical protein [Pararobbsia alpina]|uniref:hypothetical protein n=1 Tax=Pararobbsia alpina TaxID=621374 RepID=UPI0039A57B53